MDSPARHSINHARLFRLCCCYCDGSNTNRSKLNGTFYINIQHFCFLNSRKAIDYEAKTNMIKKLKALPTVRHWGHIYFYIFI